LTKESEVIVHDFLNVLLWGVTEIAIVIAEPVTSKVEGNGASPFELELMLFGQGFDNERRILISRSSTQTAMRSW